MKTGFVSIIGRPNVGKSTLMNAIIGTKIAITSSKAQTTRNNIQGIYNDDESQMIFIDTPGVHKPKYKLGKYLNKQAYFSLSDADVVLFLVDIKEPLGKGDNFIIDKLKQINKPVILIINKIDLLPKEEILPKIEEYSRLHNFAEIIPVSAMKKDNVDRLIKILKGYMKDDIKYYEDDMITNKSINFIVGEIIREKILNLTEEEVPHSVSCFVESYEQNKNNVSINGLIVVDRDSLKKIIIGSQGSMIKEIGTKARIDIERFLGQKVYLELYVKTLKNWRDKEKYLHELGFDEISI